MGCRRPSACSSRTCLPAPPELAACPGAARPGGGKGRPCPPAPRGGGRCFLPLRGAPCKRVAPGGGGGEHDVTPRWWGAVWTPHTHAQNPAVPCPFSACSRSPATISSFFAEPEVSQGGGGPRVTARHAAGGRGGGDTAAGRGRRAGGVRAPAGALWPAPHPREDRAARGPRPPATQAPRQPSPAPGLASTRALTHAGRPLPRPHPPGPTATLGAPTRGAAVGAVRVPRPLQQLQHGPPPLLGHGRDAARPPVRPRCRGRERPPRRARAPRRPPAAAAAPAPSWAAQLARRFRIPAVRPGSTAVALVAAAAAERVPARGPGRTARSGRRGPRAAPSGAGGRATSSRAGPSPSPSPGRRARDLAWGGLPAAHLGPAQRPTCPGATPPATHSAGGLREPNNHRPGWDPPRSFGPEQRPHTCCAPKGQRQAQWARGERWL